MLKINELNKVFKQKTIFASATSYNDLLGHARGLSRNVDSKDSQISELKDKIRKIETGLETLKNKYKGSVLRDPKTGWFIKGK